MNSKPSEKRLDEKRPGRKGLLERLLMWRVIAVQSRTAIARQTKRNRNPRRN